MKLLVLSNGHGEDIISVKIIEKLLNETKSLSIAALPLVGEGYAYKRFHIPMIAPHQVMPSGGFIYMDNKQLWQDIRSGLLKLLFTQYKAVRQWTQKGGFILAVGDILPLFLAWLSGANYAFVGTAKSEYYLRDELGWLTQTTSQERWWGSIYYPWERWLMKHPRCKAVFPRDNITTQTLQKYKIRAFDFGNPMMDGITLISKIPSLLEDSQNRPFIILLLPGSRTPEAERNWQLILKAIDNIINLLPFPIMFLAAIAPSLNLDTFQNNLLDEDWQRKDPKSVESIIDDQNAILFTKKNYKLILSQDAYAECLTVSDLAIAMAGTATEQFVGLGKPAIAIVGKGPQYNLKFAQNQARLLGISLRLVEKPEEVGLEMQKILKDPDFWQLIVENGKNRMGAPGASLRIAKYLKEKLFG